jgi:methanethiol S-methyltransferase
MSDEPELPSTRGRTAGNLLAGAAMVLSGTSLAAFGLFMLASGFGLVRIGAGESSRLFVNTLLSAGFFAQHSLMVRYSVRKWLVERIGKAEAASVYAITASVFLLAAMLLWQGPLTVLWSGEGAVRWVIRSLFALGLGLMAWAGLVLTLDGPLDWRSFFRNRKRNCEPDPAPTERGPYRWVRHPQYLATLMMIWSCPDLTTDRLGFNVLWSAWVLLATHWEERDLVARFGERYRDYQRRVPMLVPRLGGRTEQ